MFIKDLISKSTESNIFDPFSEVTQLTIPIKNAPTIELVKNFLPATSEQTKIKYFVIVRNPYDRIYSIWKWLRLNGIFGSPDFPEVPKNFSEFVQIWSKGGYDTYHFAQSQLNYIQNEDESNIQLFKFENMESVKNFLQDNGVGWSEEKINAVAAPSYKTVYTPDLVELVKNKCLDEFTKFGYSIEL